MQANKIGLLHHVGGGNLGDDATMEAVADNIKRRWPKAEIVALSMNPEDTQRRHGILSFPVRRIGWSIGTGPAETKASFSAHIQKFKPVSYLFKTASTVVRLTTGVFRELFFLAASRRRISSLDLLIISGGGQLTERDGPWGFPYTIFSWAVLARLVGVRCMFLNVGAGPLTHPISKYFVRRALRCSDYVSLRDDKSRELLYQIGFTGECCVYPDSAYGLEFCTRSVIPLEGHSKPIVGFAPMPFPDPRIGLAEKDQIVYDAFIQKLAGFASWLAGQSYELRFFGTDIGVDPLAIKDLQLALHEEHDSHSAEYNLNDSGSSVHELLATLSGVDFVVTCRFHGVIFAHLLNKPVLAIAHHPKVSDLMAALGLSSYCVDVLNFDLNLLAGRFALMVSNSEEIKRHMTASLTINRQRLRNQFDELFRY